MFLPATSLPDRLFAFCLWCLPTRALSRLACRVAEIRVPRIKNGLINAFLKAYPDIDMGEAAISDPARYDCLNDFFTRKLAATARPLPTQAHDRFLCPVDGQLGAFGRISAGQLCQTKGATYDLRTLLGHDDALATSFLGGDYITLYLAPHNYHRVHVPFPGRLRETLYLPGRLFGVNPRCVRSIPRLFSRNERLVSCFDTTIGPVAVVMVGAFIVGGIHTVAAGQICPPHRKASRQCHYHGDDPHQHYTCGQEMGHFMFGSSVIVLTGPDVLTLNADLKAGQPVRLNQPLGHIRTNMVQHE